MKKVVKASMPTFKPKLIAADDKLAGGKEALNGARKRPITARAGQLATAFHFRLGMDIDRSVALANNLQSEPDLERIERAIEKPQEATLPQLRKAASDRFIEERNIKTDAEWQKQIDSLFGPESEKWVAELKHKYDIPFDQVGGQGLGYQEYLATGRITCRNLAKSGNLVYDRAVYFTEFELQVYRKEHYFRDDADDDAIDKDTTEKSSLEERLALIEDYARANPQASLRDKLLQVFPELGQSPSSAVVSPSPLPSTAPEKYQGLRGPETPPAFVQRVYGEWLGHGLTRAHIRKLDSKLYDAINNWLSRPGNEWPADVDLPTLKELNDRWADRVQKEGFAPALSEGESGFALREIDRLRGVIQRRQEKQ